MRPWGRVSWGRASGTAALAIFMAAVFSAGAVAAEPAQPKNDTRVAPAEADAGVAPALSDAGEAQDTSALRELDRVIDGVAAFYDGIHHMKAHFRQVVRQKTLARTRKASGTIEFAKPGLMRWTYERPDRVLYVSDGETLWSYQPEDALVYRTRIKGSRLYHALRFLFGLGDLREAFSMELGQAHGPDTVMLRLRPKHGGQDYKELDLIVERGTSRIRESFLTDPLGNVTHYIFDDQDFKTPIDPKRFVFEPPRGVTVHEI